MQVAGGIRVVPRLGDLRCRSGSPGRGRERPAYSACLIRRGEGWDVHGNPIPRPGSLPVQQSRAGRPTASRNGTRRGPWWLGLWPNSSGHCRAWLDDEGSCPKNRRAGEEVAARRRGAEECAVSGESARTGSHSGRRGAASVATPTGSSVPGTGMGSEKPDNGWGVPGACHIVRLLRHVS